MKYLYVISLCAASLVPAAQGQMFSDDFTRGADPGPLTPWTTNSGGGRWTVTGGVMDGGPNAIFSYGSAFITNTFTNFSVQAQIRLPVGAYGGGLGGRLKPASGAHYAAWVYPENSAGGSNVLKLIKFSNYSSYDLLQETSLAAVGTNFHTLKLEFAATSEVNVYFDGARMLSVTDAAPYTSGGVSLEFWTDAAPYLFTADDVEVNAIPPVASNDTYTALSGLPLTMSAPGVLGNDTGGLGPLNALCITAPGHGTFTLSNNGGFTYTATNGYAGMDSFTYRATDGASTSSVATVTFSVLSLVPLYADSFSRTSLSPWASQSGNWAVADGALLGGANAAHSYGVAYLTNAWTNYSVQASVQLPAGAFGGGLDACLDPATGARYAAWIYPDGSAGGGNTLKLIKFQTYTSFGYTNVSSVPMQSVSLPSIGTSAHTLKLACAGNHIAVFLDGVLRISATDIEAQPYLGGGVGVDFWTDATGYEVSVDDVLVTSLANDDSYSMSQDMTLTVPAPGVLENDAGVSGSSLTAELVSGPTSGTLNLNTNGGFSYTPGAGFVGTNTFIYKANEGPTSLGAAIVRIAVIASGSSNGALSETFDGVAAPSLPPGWTTSGTGAQSAWVTASVVQDTPPNAAYVTDANDVGLSDLVSPSIALPGGQSRLSFRNYYQLEGTPPAGLDGGVLEIKIGAGSFRDILDAGGSFVSGGYNATIATFYGNPLAGRQAWSGNSGGFITTMLNLPAAGAGQTVQLRWRCGTDNATAGTGWYIDTVLITNCPSSGCWNTPPLLAPQADRKVNELTAVAVTNTATDADVPAQTLTYQLLYPPAGAAIDTNGVITWMPTEAQGPGTYTLTTRVTDDGSPPLSATNSFIVVVNEANGAPILPNQTNQAIIELTTLTVTNRATDADLPANTLTYTLLNAPSGAAIDTNGVITWTPTEAQGPGSYTLTTVVTDDGSPGLSATNSFTVEVIETNSVPVLPDQANWTIIELTTLTVTNQATDADLPANTLTYTLLALPSGAVIDANGVITWTPTEAQGPGTYTLTTRVTDDGSPVLSATNSFTVEVIETNSAPILPDQANRTITELTTLTVTNQATDADLPADTLSYTLLAPPSGAVIDANGLITWTPTESQGPGSYTLTTRVTDDGSPPLSATNNLTVVVVETNSPPILPGQTNRTILELTTLSVTNRATDPDLPPNRLTYTLLAPPPGAVIDANGVITWTPTEALGPGSYTLRTRVTDNGGPALSVTNSFLVVVDESNSPPVLPAQADRTVAPLTTMRVNNTAADMDLPANTLTYTLLAAPPDAAIDANGLITWTPTVAQHRTTNQITTVVTDFNPAAINSQYLSATNNFMVVVLSNPIVVLEAATLIAEGSLPTNDAPDPGEMVTVLFQLKNVGLGADTTSLIATLLVTNGVLLPSGPQAYGVLVAGGQAVGQPFTFLATGTCGGTVTPTLQLQDGPTDLGTVSASFTLGQPNYLVIVTQNFDSVTAPALPSGWTTSATNAGSNWRTTNSIVDTAPNAAFTPDANNVGTSSLLSPPINLSNAFGPFQLSFRNNYNLEASSSHYYDGGVLEIKIGESDFLDITNAGGVFLSGGYNALISTNYSSPIAGRGAWSGSSTGYITTAVSLPASVAGQTIQLRWRCASDNGGPSGPGWRIDSIGLTGDAYICCSNTPPLIQAVSLSNGVVTVTWSAVAGRTYRLQAEDVFMGNDWTDCPPDVTATGSTVTATYAVGSAPQRFYRVYLVP